MKMTITVVALLLVCVSCQVTKDSQIQGQEKLKLFFAGDSITSDDPGNLNLTGNSSSKSWPWQLKQILKDSTKYQFKNYAVSGNGIAQMRNQVTAILSEKDSFKTNVCFILGPINSISFEGMSGQDAFNQIRSLFDKLHSHGFKTVAISLTSRRQTPPFSEIESQAFWTQIQVFNNLMLEHWHEFADAYINLQSDRVRVKRKQTVGFAGYEGACTIYFADGVHWSDAGKMRMAKHYALKAIRLIEKAKPGIVEY